MRKRRTTQDFINDSIAIHGDRYEYSKCKFVNLKTNVIITCKKHGDFSVSPDKHLNRKFGCKNCSNRNSTLEDVINEARAVHGDEFSYEKSIFKGRHSPMTITCKNGHDFNQIPYNHITLRAGCPYCAGIKLDISDAIKRSKIIYGDEVYDYSNIKYTSYEEPVEFRCIKHDEVFLQRLEVHLRGCAGCESCKKENCYGPSKPEQKLVNDIKELFPDIHIEQNDRSIISPMELDIYMPEYKLAIEYCGIYFHSEKFIPSNYHKRKYDLCVKAGVRLITIFSDEIDTNESLVLDKISHILKRSTKQSVYARKCKIKVVDKKSKKIFFNKNHIQGDANSSIDYGLYIGDELVACMSFLHNPTHTILTRYATYGRVVGGFSKLLKYSIKQFDGKDIISFADLRWSNGDIYKETGWAVDKILPPDYSYAKGSERSHKFNFRHARLKTRFSNYDVNLTEHENCIANKWYRIYDCGKIRFKLNNEKR